MRKTKRKERKIKLKEKKERKKQNKIRKKNKILTHKAKNWKNAKTFNLKKLKIKFNLNNITLPFISNKNVYIKIYKFVKKKFST